MFQPHSALTQVNLPDVRLWHLADIQAAAENVRFWG